MRPSRPRQQATWASGDFAEIATLIVPIAEHLADAADLRAGSTVLDVACGSGNTAIAAARLGCVVTGIDYVPSLLERVRERAAAERARSTSATATPRSCRSPTRRSTRPSRSSARCSPPTTPRAAAELVRVTKPGGTIGLASWTPDGFIGEMFRTIGAHVPPPAGLASPLLWGTEEHLDELFGSEVDWTHHERTFTYRFSSADAFVDCFATYYGPTVKALEAAGDGRDALAQRPATSSRSRNRLEEPGAIAVPADVPRVGRPAGLMPSL